MIPSFVGTFTPSPPIPTKVYVPILKLGSHPILSVFEPCRECTICLEAFRVGQEATRLPCKHAFCPGCIREWLGRHGTCPTCRAVVKDIPAPPPRVRRTSSPLRSPSPQRRAAAAAATAAGPAKVDIELEDPQEPVGLNLGDDLRILSVVPGCAAEYGLILVFLDISEIHVFANGNHQFPLVC